MGAAVYRSPPAGAGEKIKRRASRPGGTSIAGRIVSRARRTARLNPSWCQHRCRLRPLIRLAPAMRGMSAISTARFSTSRRGYDGAEQRRRRTRWNHDPSLSRATTKEFNMTKLTTVAMIGALLLGRSALALAQTSSTTTTSPSGTTAAPSNTMAPVTQPTDGSHPPAQTQTKGATTGSSSSTTTTAPGPQSAMRTDQDVVNRLQAAGYSDVTDVKQDKNGYTASALKNGKRIKVDIDSNGRIETMD